MRQAFPNQQFAYTVTVYDSDMNSIPVTITGASLVINGSIVVPVRISGSTIIATLPASLSPGVDEFDWTWTQTTLDDSGPNGFTEEVQIISAPSSDAIPINTTTTFPTVAGSYSPDGPSINAYCSINDVFIAGLGVRWEELQLELNRYAVMNYPDAMTVPDLLTNHIIPTVESEVDDYLTQTYKPTQISSYFNGTGTSRMYLSYCPVQKLDFVNIYTIPGIKVVQLSKPAFVQSLGSFDDDAYYANCDILVHPETGLLFIPPKAVMVSGFPLWPWTFIEGIANVEVSWTYGFSNYSAVPKNFKSAVATLVVAKCLELTGMIEQRGLAQRKIGDATYGVGREKNLPYGDLINRMEMRARKILVKYKRVP